MGPQPPGRVGAEQPVDDDGDKDEGGRAPQFQPEDDPGGGCAAELGRQELLDRGERPVDTHVVIPGDRHGPGKGIVGQSQVVRGHDVGAMAERKDPPVGRVVKGVGGPGRWQHG